MILPRDKALVASGSLAVLRGNLAPNGAVIKPAAAEARLLKHSGTAVVFASYNDMAARIDDPALDVSADSVLVLQNAGPLGAPGMPEWGQLPIPKKILAQGVRDMLRISDARMSGTSYGACVLHVAPESFTGGPLALVRDGDVIELDVAERRLELKVSDAELARRRADWKMPPPRFERGLARCTSSTSRRPIKGAISIFSKAPRPPLSRRFTDREDRCGTEARRSRRRHHARRRLRARRSRRRSRAGSSIRTS